MPAHAFHFEIKGEGIGPDDIPLRDLVTLLGLLNAALSETAKGRKQPDDAFAYTLTKVAKGNSSDYEISGSAAAIANADVLTRAIADRSRFALLPTRARDKVRGMWKWAYDRGYEALAFEPNGSGITRATIISEEPPLADRPTYSGQTAIYGECLRAGGEKRRTAQLRLPNGKTKTVRLRTRDLAREVAGRLYEFIELEGEAVWDAKTDQLEFFLAESLTPYRDRDPGMNRPRTNIEALQDLARAAGGRWDNIDPDEFVRELRRD